MSFSSADHGASGSQLLASVGKDSKVIIWNLSSSDLDSTDIAHSKYLELSGVPQSDQPRYSRIAWSPRNASQLALVNNDDHSVFIVDIHSLIGSQLNDSPTVTEAQLRTHSLVIQAHDQVCSTPLAAIDVLHSKCFEPDTNKHSVLTFILLRLSMTFHSPGTVLL